MNAGIEEDGLVLSSFGHAARNVCELGAGCWLIKLDIKAAYKQVPVRREDWPLLGFMWEDQYYFERVLPFGLRSSCRLWEMYATALDYIIQKVLVVQGAPHHTRRTVHYVDDFLFIVKTEASARALLPRVLELCAELGLPMADDKTEGPAHCLTFLGIELDTVAMEARLDAKRMAQLHDELSSWAVGSQATLKQLESL